MCRTFLVSVVLHFFIISDTADDSDWVISESGLLFPLRARLYELHYIGFAVSYL